MILHQFENGDTLYRKEYAIIANFSGKRFVLSTSPLNGGLTTDLKHVLNFDFHAGNAVIPPLKAPTYAEHIAILATELGLDPAHSSGLGTAALMDNAVICSETYKDTTVTALVTGGIYINGGRVGEPAFWHETDGNYMQIPGTINIFLFISAHLTPGALTRALVTCTEAKVAAIQELMAPSCYSMGLATGSCTDGVIIVSDAESSVRLTEAGKHFKLGELIGKTIISATKRALYLQTGLSPEWQFNVFGRMGRFGVTEEKLWELCQSTLPSRTVFSDKLRFFAGKKDLVVYTSFFAHILDQLQWGLISPQAALPAACDVLHLMGVDPELVKTKNQNLTNIDTEKAIEILIEAYGFGLRDIVISGRVT